MKPLKPLNKFWNRSPFFYKARNVLLFRNINIEGLSQINYNKYNPIESIPKIYFDTNSLIFEDNKNNLNDFDKAIKIATWLRQHIKGGKGLGINSEDALKYMLNGGYGICSDFCQVFNNFCVINNLKVREWGLKKIGSHLDGHALNEFYAKELNKWVCIDVSKSIYFEKNGNGIPLSIIELFTVKNDPQDIKSVSFNSKFIEDDKKIHKFYFSNQYEPFVIDKYINSLYDNYLSKYKNLPIPVVHGLLIIQNRSYVYKKVTNK